MSCKECREQRHSVDIYYAGDWAYCPFCGSTLKRLWDNKEDEVWNEYK